MTAKYETRIIAIVQHNNDIPMDFVHDEILAGEFKSDLSRWIMAEEYFADIPDGPGPSSISISVETKEIEPAYLPALNVFGEMVFRLFQKDSVDAIVAIRALAEYTASDPLTAELSTEAIIRIIHGCQTPQGFIDRLSIAVKDN